MLLAASAASNVGKGALQAGAQGNCLRSLSLLLGACHCLACSMSVRTGGGCLGVGALYPIASLRARGGRATAAAVGAPGERVVVRRSGASRGEAGFSKALIAYQRIAMVEQFANGRAVGGNEFVDLVKVHHVHGVTLPTGC